MKPGKVDKPREEREKKGKNEEIDVSFGQIWEGGAFLRAITEGITD